MTSAITFGCFILRRNIPKNCVSNKMTPTHRHSEINHTALDDEQRRCSPSCMIHIFNGSALEKTLGSSPVSRPP